MGEAQVAIAMAMDMRDLAARTTRAMTAACSGVLGVWRPEVQIDEDMQGWMQRGRMAAGHDVSWENEKRHGCRRLLSSRL